MGKYTPRQKVGITTGSIIGLSLLFGVIGGHQQAPKASNLTSTPASTVKTVDATNSQESQPTPQPVSSDVSTPPATTTTPEATSPSDESNLSNSNTYTNVDGNTVHSPAYSTNGSVPAGATAQCNDGTYSFSQHHSGTCSGHGGVATWL